MSAVLPVLFKREFMTAKKKEKAPGFEEALDRLSAIVEALESGDTKLEDSLKLFEEGITLAKQCRIVLVDAMKRVEELKSGVE